MTADTWPLTLTFGHADAALELDLVPLQGSWTDAQFLRLTEQTNHLIELVDGALEVLPMPTRSHQLAVRNLLLALNAFLEPRGGLVLFAPLRLRTRAGHFREPDLLLVRDANDPRNQERFWLGADLVVEAIGPADVERDTVAKRADYAAAAIAEYWIVDPRAGTVTVLVLDGALYRAAGIYLRGERLVSPALPGFGLDVEAVFAGA